MKKINYNRPKRGIQTEPASVKHLHGSLRKTALMKGLPINRADRRKLERLEKAERRQNRGQ